MRPEVVALFIHFWFCRYALYINLLQSIVNGPKLLYDAHTVSEQHRETAALFMAVDYFFLTLA